MELSRNRIRSASILKDARALVSAFSVEAALGA